MAMSNGSSSLLGGNQGTYTIGGSGNVSPANSAYSATSPGQGALSSQVEQLMAALGGRGKSRLGFSGKGQDLGQFALLMSLIQAMHQTPSASDQAAIGATHNNLTQEAVKSALENPSDTGMYADFNKDPGRYMGTIQSAEGQYDTDLQAARDKFESEAGLPGSDQRQEWQQKHDIPADIRTSYVVQGSNGSVLPDEDPWVPKALRQPKYQPEMTTPEREGYLQWAEQNPDLSGF